jgi:hypothetical protein
MRRLEDWLETLYDLWLQGPFINFREEEIFIFGAWVYAIVRHHPNIVCQLTLPSPTPPLASSKKPEQAQRPPSLTSKKGRNVGNNGANGFQFLLHP